MRIRYTFFIFSSQKEREMLTDLEIENAKKKTNYNLDEAHHEHNDCIRIAYEWLDAQRKTKTITTKNHGLKHLIERWAGRYVSASDVNVAATMHPEIRGSYPFFNISSRLTEPSIDRLKNIEQAFKQSQRDYHSPDSYKIHEADKVA